MILLLLLNTYSSCPTVDLTYASGSQETKDETSIYITNEKRSASSNLFETETLPTWNSE
jgi:hypothetical protein